MSIQFRAQETIRQCIRTIADSFRLLLSALLVKYSLDIFGYASLHYIDKPLKVLYAASHNVPAVTATAAQLLEAKKQTALLEQLIELNQQSRQVMTQQQTIQIVDQISKTDAILKWVSEHPDQQDAESYQQAANYVLEYIQIEVSKATVRKVFIQEGIEPQWLRK